MKLLVVLCFGLILGITADAIVPTQNYPHSSGLDEENKMKLYWVTNTTHVIFEIHGNTLGWIGIGISPYTNMTGADIVVGWVKNGTGTIADHHGIGNTFPPKDPEQNVEFLNGIESDGWTLIKFQRKLAASEPGFDLPITNGSLNILFAFGVYDPAGNDIAPQDYHVTNRGCKSLVILTNDTQPEVPTSHPVTDKTSTTPSAEGLPPTENFTHSAELNKLVKLYWKFDDTYITFEIQANTNGWVGMGISPSGAMTGADIMIGWVKSGTAYITDRHGTGNTFPPKDPEQNVELLEGIESDGWTLIKFRRQLAACEPGYDLPITDDTLRIIYAFGMSDPEGDDVTGTDYHGMNRGAKSLMLLNNGGSSNIQFPEGETHSTFDLLNDKFEIPAEETYYNCKLFKLPEFSQKQHVVKIEPVLQPGNELFLHHMIVFHCNDGVDIEKVGENYRCYGSDMPSDLYSCTSSLHAWAVGGEIFYYPNHAGYPLGDDDAPKYLMMETHYDNREAKEGVIDSSGLRFTYTSQLRTYDTGVMAVGHIVSGMQHIIPPNADPFITYADCSQNCLNEALKQGNVDGLNVFGVMLHSHLIGSGITLRHIRDKKELPYIAKDDFYDFNYQETRIFTEERIIKPTDSLQVVCKYKSKEVRSGFTLGGFDSSKEMCEAFVYYYPKIPTTLCFTGPVGNELMSYFGIEKTTIPPYYSPYDDLSTINILQPEELAGQTVLDHINSMEWNEETINALSNALKDMEKDQQCFGIQGQPSGVLRQVPAIVIDEVYEEQSLNCTVDSSETTTTVETTTANASIVQLQWFMYLISLILMIEAF